MSCYKPYHWIINPFANMYWIKIYHKSLFESERKCWLMINWNKQESSYLRWSGTAVVGSIGFNVVDGTTVEFGVIGVGTTVVVILGLGVGGGTGVVALVVVIGWVVVVIFGLGVGGDTLVELGFVVEGVVGGIGVVVTFAAGVVSLLVSKKKTNIYLIFIEWHSIGWIGWQKLYCKYTLFGEQVGFVTFCYYFMTVLISDRTNYVNKIFLYYNIYVALIIWHWQKCLPCFLVSNRNLLRIFF